MELMGIILGVLICYLLWPLMERWLSRVTENNKLPPPDGIEENDWLTLACPSRLEKQETDADGKTWFEELRAFPSKAGAWLGILERILSFIAFYIDAPIVIAGWLGFKVASKWQVWTNVVQLPKSLKAEEESNFSLLVARRNWGALLLMRFLIGTLSNVLA
jgi:hypothetical protein